MNQTVSRREMLKASAALSALAFLPLSAFGLPSTEEDVTPIHFLDAQPDGKMLKWENMDSWITPNEQVFAVSHYGPAKVDPATYELDISGLAGKPRTLTLDQLKMRRKKDVIATLECSGNSSSPTFAGAIGNVRWTGTPLASLLHEAQPDKRAVEVVFFGADEKVEKIRDREYLQNFARSLSLKDALRDDIILAWEMNGQPLAKEHGAPIRLIVPGWFGIAWVKWLRRIELLDRRYMSKYMAREYVTIRGEERNGRTIWRETSVGPIDVKSVTARALRLKDGTVRFVGAAWTDGTPLKAVEVKIDKGDWQPARLDRQNQSKYGWKFWNFDWKNPLAGDHAVVSRAIDADGRVQPAAEDQDILLKRTYWEANQQWTRRIHIG
ncbi:MAG TPA: molybdopterin-dependent oxidoreductase [Verrucomicrobiae bacterium]|nr:molybdopterin-dependent oxidoreductase [Verrucomicrobiae bacterium]